MNSKMTKTAIALAVLIPAFTVSAQDWKDDAKDAWIDGKAETVLLLNTNLNNFDINTDVTDGKVVLTGKVDSDVDKALAAELVEGIDGVESVENKLTVMSNSSSKDASDEDGQVLTDTKITTVVKTRLLFESEVSGTNIEVTTKEGVVTLEGTLESEAEKDLALAIARNTDDVKRVVDNLKIDANS
ncbi:BON domain-containing protein [Shewanella sp.]|uniref:BON domain-containing protein n=1 Tax=Shewanella sp. TaxID=50422 RepID=UPI003A9875DD